MNYVTSKTRRQFNLVIDLTRVRLKFYAKPLLEQRVLNAKLHFEAGLSFEEVLILGQQVRHQLPNTLAVRLPARLVLAVRRLL